MMFRVGFGLDVHQLREGENLVLGGVEIPHTKGTVAHSDGDALIHAIVDACLGAAGLRDIGYYFPDNDNAWKNASSSIFLFKAMELIQQKGFFLNNLDATISLEKPKVKSYIPQMVLNIANLCKIDESCVSIKAGTNEKMGFVGREEGVACYAIVSLIKE